MTQVLPKERAREYESIFILHPDSQADVVDTIAGRCQDIINKLDGKLLRAENWGRRRLAYPVKKNAKGIYIYLKFLGYQNLVHELERNYRAIDSIIKFLSVKIDEDVNPDARPVSDSDISFVSTFIENEDHATEAVAEDAPADSTDEEATDTPAKEADVTVAEAPAEEAADATAAPAKEAAAVPAEETKEEAPAEEATDTDAADDSAEEKEE